MDEVLEEYELRKKLEFKLEEVRKNAKFKLKKAKVKLRAKKAFLSQKEATPLESRMLRK